MGIASLHLIMRHILGLGRVFMISGHPLDRFLHVLEARTTDFRVALLDSHASTLGPPADLYEPLDAGLRGAT